MQVQFEKIPQFLKAHGQFCNWKYELRDGNQTKVPYMPGTTRRASVSDPSTFTAFETAASATGYGGIGIRVHGRIVGIDLDHCIEDGTLLPWAQTIVDRFGATYIEVSPSGKGIRIFCLLPDGFTYDIKTYYIKKGDIEVYIPGHTNRFLTVTGNAITDADVVETAEALLWLLDTYMRRPTPPTPAVAVPGESYLSDEAVIVKASAAHNGEKFRRLWDGDITGYKSQSEADAALVASLAFWCSGDKAQMDRLFRQSGLMREKWDSLRGADTYGNISIEKAVSRMTDYYKPIIPRSAAEDFGVIRLKELDPMDSSKYPWNDIGAGHIFADFYQDRLRYVPERKMWFHYEGGIWKADTGNLRAMLYCMELADLMYTFALEIRDEDKRKSYMKYASRWQSHSNRVNILKDAQVYHPIPYGSFDADIYIFNCGNGTLHIDTGEFTEHRSTDLLTKISPVVYDPTAYSERFATYIDEIMSGDTDRAKFLQKILGYGLTGDTRHECMTILYGVTTRNGKGTLCESVLKVLGDYGCASRPETIAMKSYTNGSQPSEDVARLAGVRFVNIPEPGKGMVLDAAKVKAMTGNDTLNARFLHENSFDFQPQFKIYVNTNFLPVINDMALFSSDRIIIIPFDRHFDEHSRDTTLKRRFAEESVQSAILNWLLEGYRLLQTEGLFLPQSVKTATDRYQHDSDKLALFFEDNLAADDAAEELTARVYARYKGWCQENGCYPESMRNFRQGLESFAKVVRKRPKHGGEKTTMLIGYRLISEFDTPLLTYAWQQRTVADILVKMEYLGHTVNFKTQKKSYKSKKKVNNDPSEWVIFENTHEAIIDQETFEIVQNIRNGRRRLTPMGEMPVLSGMLFCADCGAKLYQVRARGWTREQEHFVCATYRKQKGKCTSHQIRNVQVEQILLTEINRMLAFVRERESEFVELLTKKNERDLNRQFRECSRELEQATQRITKLDSIIQRLYEDNLDGKISDERFAKMATTYEQEQKDLQARVIVLRETLSKAKTQRLNIDSFLVQVKKYTEVKELDAEIIRALVERIDVFKPEKVPGTRTKKQTILIHWNFIGAVELSQEQKKSA